MKKISTAASDKIGKVEGQRLTVGLDVGDRSSWYCVLEEAGEVLLEQKLPTTPKAMKEIFGKMPRSRIALETGMHSPWVSRLLMKLEELNRHQQIDPGPFLSAYVGMGDKEQAFAWLEKAYSALQCADGS
jgi:hypothetical protein